MIKGYAPEDIADNYNKYTSSQEGKSMQAKLSLYLFQVNALPYIYIHVYIYQLINVLKSTTQKRMRRAISMQILRLHQHNIPEQG